MSPIAIPELYRSLHTYLVQTIPEECDSRLTNLILLMMGIFQSGKVQLNLVARKTPVRAKKLSIVKRFQRFLDNGAVRVRPWYQPFAQSVLAAATSAGQVHLIMDTSKVAFGFRLVMVSVAYHHRSLPLVWTWAKGSRGHTTTATQIKLLDYVAEHVITTHQTPEIDRTDRRDLSLFRMGWDFVERRLALFDPLPSVTLPSFCLPPGGSLSNFCSVSGG